MKTKVAFVCVHNSCRSQMAEAVAKVMAPEVIEAYSAGTEATSHINEDAIRIVKKRYGIDMSETQWSKTLDEIPPVDVVITMGCNVDCPFLPARYREDWGLDDPTGKPDSVFELTVDLIEDKMKTLISKIENKQI